MDDLQEQRTKLSHDVMKDILKRLPATSLRYLKIEESTESIYYNGTNMLSFHSNDESFKCIAPNIEYSDNYVGVNIAEFWELPPSILPTPPYISTDCKKLSYEMTMNMEIGFDSNTNDYKIVRILIPVMNMNMMSLIIITSMLVSTESFKQILSPEGLFSDGTKSPNPFVLKQTLALICFTEIHYPPKEVFHQSIDIWVMKIYGVRNSWIKEFTVGPLLIEAPLSVWMNDTELMMESYNGKLVSCNLLLQETKDLDMYGVPQTLEGIVCKESLVSIKKERQKWRGKPFRGVNKVEALIRRKYPLKYDASSDRKT
ncbi:hypothetical protein H5410_003136 [Solanum commersonii]|uniref:Uncharacterized protein n=1 Tax=Solanum commersonii TaxID=4109 RepID=A0A9J6B471_SOLCO|nr:hypothetical protein H5410_003136 [Solanum commersonii]